MNFVPPEGMTYILPKEAKERHKIISTLQQLYDQWGYECVDVPGVERYDAAHPRVEQSFKLSDYGSNVLALRSDFTPAIAKLVQAHFAGATKPLRLQYCGKLWQAVKPDISRVREFTQLGLELIGVSNARADAELIHLARESVRAVDLVPRVEIGNPGFVRSLFHLAEIPSKDHSKLAALIDRKDQSSLDQALEGYTIAPDLRHTLLSVCDLYGDSSILKQAKALVPWKEAKAELELLEEVLEEFEDRSELLFDLGMARRLSYYTSITFRAYTFDFGQPLLGGGRYDGGLMPYAAGFSMGLERLMGAMPLTKVQLDVQVLSLDDQKARTLRQAGYVVERSFTRDIDEAKAYAKLKGIPYLLSEEGLLPVRDSAISKALVQALENSDD